jgi:hypothetical protein
LIYGGQKIEVTREFAERCPVQVANGYSGEGELYMKLLVLFFRMC